MRLTLNIKMKQNPTRVKPIVRHPYSMSSSRQHYTHLTTNRKEEMLTHFVLQNKLLVLDD
jgi:hypothetical protein